MAASSSLLCLALLVVFLINASQCRQNFHQNDLSKRIQEFSRLKPKLLEPSISITAQLPNPLSDESLQIREFIPEKVLHRRLPWSAKLLLKFFKNPLTKTKKTTFPAPPLSTTTTMSRVKLLFPFLDHPWIKPILEKLSPLGKSVLMWIRTNKDVFLAGTKVLAGVYILLTIARRIIHWYTGVAEYELLLDQHDFDYQTYGVHMDGFGSWILSRVDKADVEHFGYSDSYHRIEAALNKPCFPYAMNTYALHMGNELAEIVADVDVRVRAMRKGFQRANKELQSIQQQQQLLQTSPSTARSRGVSMKSLVTARTAVKDFTAALEVESDVALVLQKALVILSVRQADAYLRATRMLILMEANNCEDLLKSWREKLAKKSQTLRIPVFQNVLAKIIGFTTGSRLKNMSKRSIASNEGHGSSVGPSVRGHNSTRSSRTDTGVDTADDSAVSLEESLPSSSASSSPSPMSAVVAAAAAAAEDDVDAYSTNLLVKDLNAKEKVILLENLLKNLYIVSGRIQRHLEALQPLSLPLAEPNDETLRDDRIWQQLEAWVTQTSTLTLEAVHALSFQPAVLAAKTKSFSSGSGGGGGGGRPMPTAAADHPHHQASSPLTSVGSVVAPLTGDPRTSWMTLAPSRDASTALAMASSTSTSLVNGSVRRRFSPTEAMAALPPMSSSSTTTASTAAAAVTTNELPHRHRQEEPESVHVTSKENNGTALLPASVWADLRRLATIASASDLRLPPQHIPVVEWLIPVSTTTLVEHGLLSATRWETVLRRTGAHEVHVQPWQTMTTTSGTTSSSSANATTATVGVREIVFQQQNQPPSPSSSSSLQSPFSSFAEDTVEGSIPTWIRRQSLTQVLPLTPARVRSMANEDRGDPAVYAMATFQRFLSSSTPTETTTASATATFPASIVMYNATTRWLFTPATRADVVAWRQRTSGRASGTATAAGAGASPMNSAAPAALGPDGNEHRGLSSRVSSFVRRLFFGRHAASSSREGGNDGGADSDGDFWWTKVQVSVDIRVPPSMYRYYIASVVLGDTKRLVETWKTTMDEYFLQDDDPATPSSTTTAAVDPRGEEQDGEDAIRRLFRMETAKFTADKDTSTTTMAVQRSIPHGHVMMLSGGTAQPPMARPTWSSTAAGNAWESHSPSKPATSWSKPSATATTTTATATWPTTPTHETVASASAMTSLTPPPPSSTLSSSTSTSSTPSSASASTTAMSTYPWAATSPPSTMHHRPAVAVMPTHSATSFAHNGGGGGGNTVGSRTTTTDVSFTPTASSRFTVDHQLYHDLHRLEAAITHHERQLLRLRASWQTSGVILKDLTRVSHTFATHLQTMGLRKRMHQGIYAILRVRVLVSLIFWTSLCLAGFELNKRSEDISWGLDFLWKTSQRFVKRRIAKPTLSIVNDVILNKRTKITDVSALSDAQRSLRAMLYDFLLQNNPGMSETERQRLATAMDMRPISEAYEQQLKHPMRNIVRGSIARLVLIQLQFVKKELLVAMQAIDELFNANQVNLQLLAVTPAILAVFGLQVMGRLLTSAVKATTKGGGTMIESAAAVYRDVKLHLREIERVLVNSEAYRTVRFGRHSPTTTTTPAAAAVAAAAEGHHHVDSHLSSPSVVLPISLPQELSAKEWGEILSILHRIHLLLMIHSGTFDTHNLQQLQEDLRDIVRPCLSVQQRLSILERIHRHYGFLHSSRRMFGGGFMQ